MFDRTHISRRLALAAGLAALALPAAAQADSIVYVDGGNVWSSSVDGAHKVQLTDGGDWHSPTQADDGTIAAVKGTAGDITVMTRDGRPLRTITTTYAPAADGSTFAPRPVELSFSPDGSKIAYSYASETCTPGSTCGAVETATLVTDANATTATPRSTYGYETGVSDPEWASASRLFASGGAGIGLAVVDVPSADQSRRPWMKMGYDVADGELSRDGRHLVFIGGYGENKKLAFWTSNGDPRTDVDPAAPSFSCQSTNGDGRLADPSWSPDGLGLAMQDKLGLEVWRFSQIDADGCVPAGTDDVVISPTGSEPDWGPADPPAARAQVAATPPAKGQAPAPGTTQPGTPAVPGTRSVAFTVGTTHLTRTALRRGKATVRLTAGAAGKVTVRVRSGRTTIATGTATTKRAGTVTVRLSKASRKGLAALRGRRGALVTATLRPATGQRLEQSRTIRVR